MYVVLPCHSPQVGYTYTRYPLLKVRSNQVAFKIWKILKAKTEMPDFLAFCAADFSYGVVVDVFAGDPLLHRTDDPVYDIKIWPQVQFISTRKMIGPFTEHEEEVLETLESELLEKQIPYVLMMKMYAIFLHTLALETCAEKPDDSPAEMAQLIKNLEMAIASFGTEYSDESRKSGRLELWGMIKRLEQKQLRLAALVRCAVCCFYDESGWNPDHKEDLTPIPLYLFLLKKFDPGIGLDFVAYVRTHLLASR